MSTTEVHGKKGRKSLIRILKIVKKPKKNRLWIEVKQIANHDNIKRKYNLVGRRGIASVLSMVIDAKKLS